MKTKKALKLIEKIESLSGKRNFSKKEVLNFIEITEMEMNKDEKVDEFYNQIINSYKTYNEIYDELYEKF